MQYCGRNLASTLRLSLFYTASTFFMPHYYNQASKQKTKGKIAFHFVYFLNRTLVSSKYLNNELKRREKLLVIQQYCVFIV